MELIKECNLSEFINKDIMVEGDKQYVILDYFENKPVRILGYHRDLTVSSYDLKEGAYYYMQELVYRSKRLRANDKK
jgi:hypothetical protein